MKNKHYFLLLCVIALSTIFSVFAFTGVDTGISKLIFEDAIYRIQSRGNERKDIL